MLCRAAGPGWHLQRMVARIVPGASAAFTKPSPARFVPKLKALIAECPQLLDATLMDDTPQQCGTAPGSQPESANSAVPRIQPLRQTWRPVAMASPRAAEPASRCFTRVLAPSLARRAGAQSSRNSCTQIVGRPSDQDANASAARCNW